MTTNDSAAAWRARGSLPLILAAVLSSFALAGCETTSNILASAGGTTDAAQTQLAQPASTAAKPLVAIAPVIGAPEPVAGQFKSALATALGGKGITAATSTDQTTAYTLRGYIVSAREPAGTKVSYIWDVTTPAGKRVNRITGEELVAGAPASRDPWSAVSPGLIQTISGKTADKLVAWLPSQGSVTQAVAGAATSATTSATATATTAASQVAGSTQRATSAVTNAARQAATTTGSIGSPSSSGSGGITAIVPSVTGAPGDGSVALANALRRELQNKGVRMASAASPSNYRVEGKVNLGPKTNGKQTIAIDWHVKQPNGTALGTVSQKNEIPAGSLDGAWGQTANAAAAAAAHGIAELLVPKKTASR
ncbi:MAG: hypothetical protein AAFO75_07445 [Pseudomonadota bacterium]